MGKRGFAYQLLHPITNESTLNMEYNITEHIIKKRKNFENIKLLNKLSDMTNFTEKSFGK